MNKRAFLLILLMALPVFAASISSVWVYPCLVVKNQECRIEWASSGPMADHVNITLWRGGVKGAEVLNVPNISGNNEKVWLVPASLPTGKYIFRVTTVDGLVQGEMEHPVDNMGMVLVKGPSGTLFIGSATTVSWQGFGLGTSPPVWIDLYRNGALVDRIGSSDMSHSSGCGRWWTWEVGTLGDLDMEAPTGETAPAGSGYKIRVSNDSGQYYAETDTFSIANKIDPGLFRNRFKLITRIPVFPGPGCPMCGEVQLSDILEIIRTTPEAHAVELWHAGRSLGKLVEPNRVRGNQSMQRIDFGNSFQQLKQGGSGFELRIFDNRGKLLHTHAVVLNYKAK